MFCVVRHIQVIFPAIFFSKGPQLPHLPRPPQIPFSNPHLLSNLHSESARVFPQYPAIRLLRVFYRLFLELSKQHGCTNFFLSLFSFLFHFQCNRKVALGCAATTSAAVRRSYIGFIAKQRAYESGVICLVFSLVLCPHYFFLFYYHVKRGFLRFKRIVNNNIARSTDVFSQIFICMFL